MPTSLLPPKSLHTASRSELSVAHEVTPGSWPCLIVSPDSKHQQLFSRAAAARGWNTFATSDPHEALKLMCRNSFKMAVLDFQDSENLITAAQLENYRSLADYIRWLGGVLLVINGPEQDSPIQSESVELWARQLGSWSYVPGVLPQSDLSDLCDQAFQVVERLHHPSRS